MAAVVSPNAGTRNDPLDSYVFVRGTTATFKQTFLNEGSPTTVDNLSIPVAKIMVPNFLAGNTTPLPIVVATLNGSLVPGQNYEYQFVWAIPFDTLAVPGYIVSYEGMIGGVPVVFGDEYFDIAPTAGTVGLKPSLYATVDDVRAHKFNIDSYLPESARTVIERNNIIEKHLRNATTKLREELALFKQRSYTENYRLFCIFYTVWSVMMASRGEDGSSVSSEQISEYRSEWQRILAQEKRKGQAQGIPLGRG